MLMPMPFLRLNSCSKAASVCAAGSFLAKSHAAESVSDAPKPSICWKRWLASMLMTGTLASAALAEKWIFAPGASPCFRSGVVV